MPAAHRHDDLRTCGATTVVSGQSTVFVNNKLWAVDNDENSHGGGGLNPSGTTVFIENKLVIVNAPDDADPDNLCPGPLHCDPDTAAGSPNVSCYG